MNTTLLEHIPLFAGLSPGERHAFCQTLSIISQPAQTILLREGEPGDSMFIVLHGALEIIKALDTPDERVLGVRGPGEFVGEMSLLNPRHVRTATIRTRHPSRLLTLTRTDFDRLLQQHPAVAAEMLRVLSMRLREADNATIRELRERNRRLTEAYAALEAAQAQIVAEARRRERIEHELSVARTIQQSMLPTDVPHLPDWQIHCYYQPAREVGGDFYDFLRLPDGRLGVVIGDVTGKGVPAALVMAMSRSMIRSAASQFDAPGALLVHINELLCHEMPPGMFVTCFYAILEPTTGRVQFANAGHELPYRWGAHGVDELKARGMPLGLMPGMVYGEGGVTIAPNQGILFHSDGVVEAHDPAGQMFGFARLKSFVGERAQLPTPMLVDELLHVLHRFTGSDWEQEDDITLVAIRHVPAPCP